jgi:hypothetical protein
VRTRSRTCTNPEPKFNGRLCVGLDQEEGESRSGFIFTKMKKWNKIFFLFYFQEICTQEMINPCATLNNHQWMSWGSWEECSKPCGEGFQMRRRLCNGKHCAGCNQEWRTCNTEPCKGKTKFFLCLENFVQRILCLNIIHASKIWV